LKIGFDYSVNAVLKRVPDTEDFSIVKMEWGYIPPYLKTRADVLKMRNRYYYKDKNYRPPIITLNAVCEELLAPSKIYHDAVLQRRCLIFPKGFFEW
jgi:putative SOS response-associated peptidase YedK